MDRNFLARQAAKLGAAFARKNNVLVPERIAEGGGAGAGGVAVAVIARGDAVATNFAMALAATEYMLGRLGINFFLINRKGDVPAESRNIAVEQARAMKAAFVLLLDANVTFPPNALPRLLQLAGGHGADILGPTVPRREHPHENLAVPKCGGGQTVTIGGLVEVDALPAAMLLIRMSALEKMKRPYFRYPVVEEGWSAPHEFRYDGMEEGKPQFINDMVYFGAAARRAGLKVWLDTELSCYMVNWGEAGYQLTGAEEGPQYRILEAGQITGQDANAGPAAAAANEGPKIQVAT